MIAYLLHIILCYIIMSPPLTPPPESRHIHRPNLTHPLLGPKTIQDLWKINKFGFLGLLGLQEGLKMAQDGPKTAQDGPRWPQEGPRGPKDGPRGPP